MIFRKKPKSFVDGFFAWFGPSLFIREVNYLDTLGLDSIMFLQTLNFCMNLFLVIVGLSLPLLLINYYAPEISGLPGLSDNSGFNLSLLTMQNMNYDSGWMLLYVLVTYIYSMYAYYLLYSTWVRFVGLKRDYYRSESYLKTYSNRTLLMTRLPESLKTSKGMSSFLQGLSLNEPVDEILIGKNPKDLNKLMQEHTKLVAKLEPLLQKYYKAEDSEKDSERPMHKDGGMLASLKGKSGEKVDTISSLCTELQSIEEQIYTLRAQGDEAFETLPYAFISFATIQEAQKSMVQISDKMYFYKKTQRLVSPHIRPCPDLRDIIWANLGLTRDSLLIRKVLMVSTVIAITLLWTIIVIFVSSLTQIQNIAKISQALADAISSSPAGILILQSIIAPVLLIVLNLLVPIIFRALGKIQGILSNDGVEKSVFRKYFWFQVYQTFVFIASSSLLPVLTEKGIKGLIEGGEQMLTEATTGFVNVNLFLKIFIS